jgi:hypothetical protein
VTEHPGRFAKGRSGNPSGRPKQRRPHVSAFDIVFDKTLTVTQGGTERGLTVDEALQLQTYQAALKGSKMAVRAVLKMIEKREAAIAKKYPVVHKSVPMQFEYDSGNADAAMLLLGIAVPAWPDTDVEQRKLRLKLSNWAAQAAISRPGRKQLEAREHKNIASFVEDAEKLRWPRRGRR